MNIVEIEIKNIYLDLENPRHEPYQSQDEVIEYLCKNEYVYALAQDIVKLGGINPLEVMAVIGNDDKKTYFIAEGNRRLCALKLLQDPELAPSDFRKEFKKLSENWKPIKAVPAIIFDDRDSVREWLERIHGGLQGGIGRKTWSSEQKTRFTGDIKNLMAQQLLDYAQKKNMISPPERVGKISTVQRFLSNALFKDALGVDTSKNDELQRIRPESDFDILLGKFVEDIKVGKVNTRFNSPEIKTYSHELRSQKGLSQQTIPAQPVNVPDAGSNSSSQNDKPKTPSKPRYLKNQEDTEEALKQLGNYKLLSLYTSLHRLLVAEHCPLLTIGLWAFLESLTALHGRHEGVDFPSYLNPQLLTNLGLGSKQTTKALREAIKRISENGNTTKHDGSSASYHDLQLINDFDCLHPLIKALAIAAKK